MSLNGLGDMLVRDESGALIEEQIGYLDNLAKSQQALRIKNIYFIGLLVLLFWVI